MIVLKSPQNGGILDLLTDVQIDFLESDRSSVNVESFEYLNLKRSSENDCSFPKEIEFEWEADGESTLQISESETFNVCYSKLGNNTEKVENLKCGTRYFWRVICRDEISDTFYFDTSDRYPRFIKIDGITNVRDCGGWKTVSGKRIKQGLLYRGSEMNSHIFISEKGLKTMREVLKIKSVLDIRGTAERLADVYKGNYINIPVMAYSGWFTYPEITFKIFEFLSNEENYPIYFHCWGGADRTGTLAFLIGAVLGQTYDNLLDDYEITTLSIWGDRSRNEENTCKRFLEDFNALEGETVQEKATKYLLSCGVSEASIEKFRKIMLY